MASIDIVEKSRYMPLLLPLAASVVYAVIVGGVGGVSLAVAFFVSCVLCLILALRYVNGMSRAFSWLLSITSAVLILGCALNIHTWIYSDGASLSQPALMCDYKRDFYAASQYASTGEMDFFGNASYVMALGLLFKITGANIGVPLIVNSLITLGTIIVGARMTVFLLHPENPAKTMFWAGLCISSVANLILVGTTDLKDAGAVLSFTCMAFPIAVASRRRLEIKTICLAAFGALLMIVFKSQLAVFIAAGIVLVAIRKNVGSISDCIFLLLLVFVILICGSEFQMSVTLESNTSDHSLTAGMLSVSSAGFYGKMMYEYYFWPVWLRVIVVPFTAAVQTLMPLPWHFIRDMSLGAFFPYGHFTFPWYVLFWMISSFYFFILFRPKSSGLNRWALFWIVCYCGVAFYSCGTTARYFLPFIPTAVPLALRTAYCMKDNRIIRRRIVAWGIVYSVGLVVALITTYLMLK